MEWWLLVVVLAACFSAVGCVCADAVHAACYPAPNACYPVPAASYPAPAASYPAPAACFPARFGLYQVNASPAHIVLSCETCTLSMICVYKAALILGHLR